MATLHADGQTPVQVFELDHCIVTFFNGWAWTEFRSGQGWGAVPSYDDDYYAIAADLGYGSDINRYCVEHDFCHSFVEQELFHRPSPIIWSLAHGVTHPWTTVYEEAVVQAFQKFLRGGARMSAVAPDVDWWAIREKAWGLLGRDIHGATGK